MPDPCRQSHGRSMGEVGIKAWVRSRETCKSVESLGRHSRRYRRTIEEDVGTPWTIQRPRRARRRLEGRHFLALGMLASTLHGASAQSCISLSQSSQCPAFNSSSISTDSTLTGLLYVSSRQLWFWTLLTHTPSPFLSTVTDIASFDQGLQTYVSGAFAQQR